MKTTSQKNTQGLLADTALTIETAAADAEYRRVMAAAAQTAAAPRTDSRLPIDSEARKTNRTLPTSKVLELLQQHAPSAFDLAEVVGKWVWVTFRETPAAELRQQLSQLGFHWNRTRQAWQHPCGQFRLSSASDPHEKYQAYHPADVTTN